MSAPCTHCPFLKTTPESHRALLRQQGFFATASTNGFPCHERHPDATILHAPSSSANDCVGWAQYQAKQRGQAFPDIVREVLAPAYQKPSQGSPS